MTTASFTMASPASSITGTGLKRSRDESQFTDMMCPSSAPSDGERSREKLLLLLEVASNPAMSTPGSDKNNDAQKDVVRSPIPAPPIAQAQDQTQAPPSAPQPAAEVDPEKERKKRCRIEYAMSVLNAGSAKSRRTLEKAVEEAKRKRARVGFASLTGAPFPIEYDVTKSSKAPSGKKSKGAGQGKKATNNGGNRAPPPKRRRALKRTFAEKLMAVLSNPRYLDAVSWLEPAGDSFVIVSPKKFVTEVLPRYFKTAKFESFTRKLNRWGFKRISRPGTANAVAYRHEYFRRDAPELCKKMNGGRRGDGEDGELLEPEVPPPRRRELLELEVPPLLATVARRQPQQEELPRTEAEATEPAEDSATATAPGTDLGGNHVDTHAKLGPAPSSASTTSAAGGLYGMLSRLDAPAGRLGVPVGHSSATTMPSSSSMAKLELSQRRVVASAEARQRRFRDTLRRAAALAGSSALCNGGGGGDVVVPSSFSERTTTGSSYYDRRMAEIAALYSGENRGQQDGQGGAGGSGGSYLRRIRRNFHEKQAAPPPPSLPPMHGAPLSPPAPSTVKDRDMRLLARMNATAREEAAAAPAIPSQQVPPAEDDDNDIHPGGAATAIQMRQFRLRQIAAVRARHARRIRAAARAQVARAQHAHQEHSAHAVAAAAQARIRARAGGGGPGAHAYHPRSTPSA